MSGIRLVTRADDAGMHQVANHAIRETVLRGIVRNISLMAPTPAIRNAFQQLGDLGDRVDFGLHVTLTAEWDNLRWGPLTRSDATKSFTRKDGSLPYTVDELAGMNPDLDAVMAEVEAQYELLANLGFEIRYLDEHMGIGQVPGLGDRLNAFAKEKGLVSNRELMAAGKLARLPGWDGPAEHPGTELADALAPVPAGTYLLVGHPATKDDEMQPFRHEGLAPGDVAVQRNRQRRMFMDIEIVDYCENVGIELLRYSEV
jgi:hypothetical protein